SASILVPPDLANSRGANGGCCCCDTDDASKVLETVF
ncbi:unnamed protein product, partial [Rotaria magnacalcarata]